MRYVVAFFWVLILVVATVFVVLNSSHVQFDYYFGKVSIYLPFLLFVALIMGALLGFLAMLPWWWRGMLRLRGCKSALKKAEKEINNLRHLPMKDVN